MFALINLHILCVCVCVYVYICSWTEIYARNKSNFWHLYNQIFHIQSVYTHQGDSERLIKDKNMIFTNMKVIIRFHVVSHIREKK